MSCELLPVTEFSTIADAWDALNEEFDSHPLLESRFFATALRYLGTGEEKIAVFGGRDRPDAIAVVSPTKLGLWSTFQPSQAPIGALIARPGTSVSSLKDRLFQALPISCQIVSITQQDPDLLPRPLGQSLINPIDYIETARITIDKGFDDYWSLRGKNLRHNMKRQRNRLQREDVGLRLERLDTPEMMLPGVRSYGELESLGWKANEGTAVHPDNAQGRFYAALLEQYAATGDARVYRFFYDERLSAVDLCIRSRSAFVILKTTYDETVKTSSPALLMRREYFPAIFDGRESGRIEFYGKVMDWHTKWSDEFRTMYHINLYRNAMVGKLHNRR